jgi:hypothetical protein
MFSRRRLTPAAAAMLVCLSALIISAAFTCEISHAKVSVKPIVQPGDPDEFETRVSGPEFGGGKKNPLSSDSSEEGDGTPTRGVPREDVKAAAEALPFEYRAPASALKRFLIFVVMELDVM